MVEKVLRPPCVATHLLLRAKSCALDGGDSQPTRDRVRSRSSFDVQLDTPARHR
jgi:hypothetical protein